MREAEVRQALHRTELQKLFDQDGGGRIIDELGVFQGDFRIDVAVVTNKLHGYEIKSAKDNLDRLPKQQASYNRIFDKLTLVADEKHVEEAVRILPDWWGLISVCMKQDEVILNEIWPPRQNLNVEADAICQLLWREEALQILKENGLARGLYTRSRKHMWRVLAGHIDLSELKLMVCKTLRTRTGWR